ncbi:hypothetical protein KsCSTR_09080 [Candidatus Kuenenia stuttgartiensis]|uniref:Uncharacterized protein n=1 Tax=Kuenenia stuttgartiensis TaxID=174633 RepID=Q1PZ45_KUEST|nr:hypothetical protein KsCSTR_09080 [Candidatus Kuenenia stuttgartiensis]CAJ72347.1 unknown protein [Candidatus Kuenenia stuttgartiensis]
MIRMAIIILPCVPEGNGFDSLRPEVGSQRSEVRGQREQSSVLSPQSSICRLTTVDCRQGTKAL